MEKITCRVKGCEYWTEVPRAGMPKLGIYGWRKNGEEWVCQRHVHEEFLNLEAEREDRLWAD